MQPTKWEAASGARAQIGTKRDWWVSRYLHGHGVTGESLTDASGRIRTFSTFAEADMVAKELNREPDASCTDCASHDPGSVRTSYKTGELCTNRFHARPLSVQPAEPVQPK